MLTLIAYFFCPVQGDDITWLLKGNLKRAEYDALPQALRDLALSTKSVDDVTLHLTALKSNLSLYSGSKLKKLAEDVVASEKMINITFKAGAETLVQRAGYIKVASPKTIVEGLPHVGRSGIKLSWAFARFAFHFSRSASSSSSSSSSPAS